MASRSPARISELVFRTIYSYRNAELQLVCKAQGHALSPLTPGEARMAWERNLQPLPQARAWEYWSTRLKKAGEYPAGAPKARSLHAAPAAAAAAVARSVRFKSIAAWIFNPPLRRPPLPLRLRKNHRLSVHAPRTATTSALQIPANC